MLIEGRVRLEEDGDLVPGSQHDQYGKESASSLSHFWDFVQGLTPCISDGFAAQK